jgi:N-acetylmuramoyl-L-alanine amidase
MAIIQRPSPNYDERKKNISALVLHYTGMKTAREAIDRLCDPIAKVSSHYVIDEDGTTYQLVDESKRAWHAGVSSWRGESDVNSLSIGIELVNPGHEGDYPDFPPRQIAALILLAKQIIARHNIQPANVIGHSDVAPDRKIDPGEKFPWDTLAKNLIGLYPPPGLIPLDMEIKDAQEILKKHGYKIEVTGAFDDDTKCVLSAFQRHFRPHLFDGDFDTETAAILGWIEINQ